MRVRGALATALLLTLLRGTALPYQTATASGVQNNVPGAFRLAMDRPRPMSEVLAGSFSADGNIQIVTRTLLVKVTDTVQPVPILGDQVGAYISPGANGGVAVQMSAFGETQEIPVPADFSGMHEIFLPQHARVQRIAASSDSEVVAVIAVIADGLAPAAYLLLIVDGVHFTKIAEVSLTDEPPAEVRVSGDGGTVAVGYTGGLVRLWDVHTKSELPSLHTLAAIPAAAPMIGASFLDALCLSTDGSHAFLAQADLRGQIVDRTGQSQPKAIQLPGRAGMCAFDPQGKSVAVGAGSSELLEGLDGKSLWLKSDAAAPSSYVTFREDGKQLLFVDNNGAHTRSVDSGEISLSFIAYSFPPQTDWTAWSPAGRFDGSQEGIRHLRYAPTGSSSAPLPVDALVRDYYTPGLVRNVLAGKVSAAVTVAAPPAITQTVQLRQVNTPAQSVSVAINVTDANKSGHASVRLLRNGILAKRWQNLDLVSSNGAISLTATVALLPGMNHLLAYSYDGNGTKSADAVVDCAGPQTVEPGTLHVLAVGINHYRNNRGTNLSWSEADANLISQVLSAQRAQINQQEQEISSHPEMKFSQGDRAKFARAAGPIDVTTLPSDDASRENILSKIQAIVTKARPQDTVVLFFAGHGTNRNGTFYFLASDIAAFDSKYSLDTVPVSVLSQGAISDRDLESALEPLDAGTIALIFDACESGQVLLASTDTRRGPVDAQGFAQLAFEKGISLLAATPSGKEATEAAAFESKNNGHGWLPYELGLEGLQNGDARISDIDASIYMDALLRYAAQEVPKHIAQEPTVYLPNRPAADQALVGLGAVVLDPATGKLFQNAGNATLAAAGDATTQFALGELTLQTKNQKPAFVTAVSLEGNQLVVSLARTSRIDKTQWGGSTPVVETLPLASKLLILNPQTDLVELGNDGQYSGVDATKLTTYPLPAGWKDEASIVVRSGILVGVVQSQATASGGSLQAWDISKNQLLRSKPSTYLGWSAISNDGKLLALNVRSEIQLVQSDNGNARYASIQFPNQAPFDGFQAVALSGDNTLLATSAIGANTTITIWNPSVPPSDRVIWMSQPHDFATQLLFFSTGSGDFLKNMLAAGLADGTISVYQWQPKAAAAQQFESGGQKISVLSVSPDGSVLTVGTTDGVISLFDLGKQTLLLRLRWVESADTWIVQDNAGHFDAPKELWNQLSWSQNGKRTAVQSSQHIESLATKVLRELPSHQ
jgi:WD40 repeat protein/uncharacterized caspase-like protein